MIDDIFEFVMEYIVAPFMCVLIVGFVGLCVVGLFCIPSCIKEDKARQEQIKECFMQEPRTKECEYLLWQYELKKKEPKNRTTVMPMPVIVR